MAEDRIRVGETEYKIPAYAKETSLVNLIKAVESLAKAMGNKDEELGLLGDMLDNVRDGRIDFDEGISGFTNSVYKIMKSWTKDIGSVLMKVTSVAGEKMLSFAGGIIKTGAMALVASLGLSFSSIKDTLNELKTSFGELNKVGLNLSAGFGENLALGTQDLMNEFMGMGLSMQELTGIMTSNTFAMAANRKTFMSTAKTLKDLSNSGIAYGLTVSESNQLLAEELDFKSQLLFQDQVNAEEAAKQADTLFREQMGYTKLLGKSIEQIRKSSQDILRSSSSALSLVALQGEVGSKTLDGLNSFASGLIASGVTEDFTTALLEAGTGIDMFANEATRQAFTTLSAAGVDIYGTMSTFRALAQKGDLSVENAGDQVAMFREQIANISEEGMSQLRVMAAAGDAGAQSMISMVASVKQARQSAKDLAKAGGGAKTGEQVYDELLEVEKNFRLISGAFSRFRQQIATALLPAITIISKTLANPRILTALTNAGTKINQALTSIAGPGLTGLVDIIENFIESASNTVVSIINFFRDTFKTETKATGEKVTPTLTGMISDFLGNLFDNLFSSMLSAMAMMGGTVIVTGAALAGIAWGVGKFASPKVTAGTVAILGISAAIWTVSKALQNFSTIDVGKSAAGLTMSAVAVGGLLATAQVLGTAGAATLKPLAIGLGIVAGSIGILGLSVRAFPFDELTNMLNALTKLSEVKDGAFSNLAEELKPLSAAVIELTNAATGGVGATMGSAIKSLFTDKAKTPIGILADDLERMAAVARTLPPAMSGGGLGTTAISPTPAQGQSQAVASAAAQAAAAAPLATREQVLLTEILAELKKSITVLKNIQQTAQNSAT